MTSNFRLSDSFQREASSCRPLGAKTLVSDIFFPMPDQWGLRGDKYLWGALAAYFSQYRDLQDDFRATFRREFGEMTRHDFDTTPEDFHVERFSHGGMSSGGICISWWRNIGFPLLCLRHDALKDAEAEAEAAGQS